MKHFISHLRAALLLLVLPFATLAQTGVGIGTTAPDASAALDIVSSTKGALLPRVADATAIASPATGLIVFQTGGTAGFYYNVGTPAAPSWQQIATAAGAAITASNGLTKTGQNVALGGTLTGATDVPLAGNNLTFSGTTGNVGIGTSGTLPSRLTISPATAEPKITLYNGASTINYYGLGISSYQLNYHTGINAGSHVFYAGGTNGDGTELLRIKNNGNVGIGTNNPRGQLDAAGTGDIYLVNSPNTGTTQTLYLPGHLFVAPFNGSNVSYLQARRADNSGTTALRLRTYNNGTLTETMHLEGNGNVGIGTTSPSFRLEVGGSFRSTLTNGNFSLYNNSATGGTVLLGALDGTGGNGPQFRFSGAGSGFMDIGQSAAGDFVVEGNDVARLTVLNGGSVGVGTSTPTARLDVEGGGLLVGNNTAISAQGTHLQWNRTGGEGETWLLNQKGLSTNGNDGIRFGSATQANGITEWGRFNGNGNFGLNQPNPTATLHVGGAASTVRLEGLAGTGTRSVTVAADGTLTTAASPSGTDFVQNQTAAAQAAGFNISGSGAVGGRLGVGTATPNARLEAVGDLRVGAAPSNGQINTFGSAGGTGVTAINLGQSFTLPAAATLGSVTLQSGNTFSTTLTVYSGTGNGGTALTAALPISFVAGTPTTLTFPAGLSLAAGTYTLGLVTAMSGNSLAGFTPSVYAGGTLTGNAAPIAGYDLAFTLTYAASGATTLYAATGGSVGIGTDTPGATLDVAGAASTVRLQGLAGGTTRTVTVGTDGTLGTTATPSGTDFIQNQTSADQTGGFRVSGNGLVGGSLGIGTTSPFSQLANTPTNMNGSNGQGGNAKSLTWAGSQTGYMALLYNGQVGGAHGLAVKVAGSDVSTSVLDVSAGTAQTTAAPSLFKVQANGYVGVGVSGNPAATLHVGGAASTVRLEGLGNGTTTRNVTVAADGTLTTAALPSGTNFIQNQTSAQTADFNVSGTATVAGATNINTGTSTAATNIGTGTGANTVSVGNSAGTVAVTGATTVTGTTTLNGSGTATTSIGSGTATGTTNINTGAASGATNIGTGSAAGAVTIGRSGGTVTIPKLTTAGLVTTDASGNLSSSSSGVANGLFWGLGGNSGTTPGTHFLGTTDAQDVVFKAGGTERMRLKQNGALSLSVGGAGGNTFVGENSGQNVVVASAYSNTFLGSGAGQSSTTGVNNTYVGTVAGRYATIASNNTAVGTQAGANMSKSGSGGSGNSLVGSSAGNLIDAGVDNTLMGNNAGRSIVGNSGNSFFGAGTGELSTGTNNTFIGTTTGASMLSGNQNVFLGASAGRFELGSGNIHIGYNAGPASGATAGTNNTLLGNNATISAGLSNATAIGNGASVTASNALVLGSGANVGIGTTAPFTQLTNVPTASNVIGSDNNGVGSQSLNWVNTTAGYAGAFYNSSTGGAGNGLAVKVAGTSGVALDVSQNAAVGTAGTTLLRVGGNGNVGIGTSTAVSRLSFGSAVNANAAAGRLAIYEGASGTEFYGLGLVLGPSSYGMGLWGGSGAANPYNGSTGTLPQLYLDRNSANAGIGTITPGTRLDVNGGLTLEETASTALTGASPSYVIPANVSMVRLVPSGTAPTGTIALSSTTPVTGQQLYVNNTTTIPATLSGLTIGAGTGLGFFYSNGVWQATVAVTAAGNGLTNTAGTINLGGTLTAATTTLTAGANTYAITQNANPLTLAVDQSDIAAVASNYTYGNNYQTFTAGVTGILSQVELQLGTSGGVVVNFTITIRAGAGTGGAVLYSGATSYTGTGGQTNYAFPVSAALTSGSTYTIQLTDPSAGAYWSYNNANPYAGGSANINAAYDFLFRTTVASPGAAVANWPVFTAKGGLIGIGTATPSYTLDVNGYVRCTSLTQTSDARLKQDVRPIGQALAAVQALRGVRYTFRRAEFPAKQLPVGEQLGFLAQEVEKVYPELVSTDTEGFKAVNYAQLTPVLLEAIKELNARNTALQGQVNALQGRAAQADTDHASLLTLQAQMARLLGEAPAGAQARK